MAKVLVLYYSSHGHVDKLAHEIAAGAREAGASADVKRVPELLSPEAAKAANYKLDQTTSPSTTRSSYAWARASAGCRPKWQASSTRLGLWAKGALQGKGGGAFDSPATQYGGREATLGFILLDDETPIRLTPHTLVIVPPGRAMTVAVSEHPTAPRNAGKHNNGGFMPGSSQWHTVGDDERALVLACGCFRANYGPALDLFASLATPVVETFDVHDQLDQVMAYAIAELAAQDIGGGPMSAALLKLALLALLRRCLVSTNAWVERFSILSDPPIARAFAEMASRPSVPHNVQSLSHAVGLRRSAFVARFSAAFGESPMSLLRRVRMRHAADLLTANALSIDQAALRHVVECKGSSA